MLSPILMNNVIIDDKNAIIKIPNTIGIKFFLYSAFPSELPDNMYITPIIVIHITATITEI